MMRTHIFGPVPSRRLGLSLGVDLTPGKTCNFDCLYCQLIQTEQKTIERMAFCSPEVVLKELEETICEITTADWITISGTGEPTLHLQLGEIMAGIKKISSIPVCVITNSSLLWMPQVRDDLQCADHLLPTLTTTFQRTFEKIHRPHPGLSLERILGGLELTVKEFKGSVELELFVCPSINDTEEEIEGLRVFISRLERLSAVYLNAAVRTPLEKSIRQATSQELERFKERLNLSVPVSTALDKKITMKKPARTSLGSGDDVIKLLMRHPTRTEHIETALNISGEALSAILVELESHGKIVMKSDGTWALTACFGFE